MEFKKKFSRNIIATRVIPRRTSSCLPIPEETDQELKKCLEELGYGELFSHQSEMLEKAIQGQNVIITTGTASGKSLSFYLPVLHEIIKNPSKKALFIYPTKALTQDQKKSLQPFENYFGHRKLKVGIYDGDTPASQRKKIRQEANIILTNPDMINSSFLPNHNRYGFPHIFRNLSYIVIDELHAYRGAFGSHLSNVIRRIIRICRYHNNSPKFLCSSATIANPRELAENICHSEFFLISKDGSPAPEKELLFWQPPLIGQKETFLRRSVRNEMIRILPVLIKNEFRFIAFCRSRKDTEIVTKECKDKLNRKKNKDSSSNQIAGYRGGYTPIERRKIEKDLLEGKITGVVSTNALELGIDIGALEFVVMGGFPGTRASFWQQLGRAGRKDKKAYAILILDNRPLDQFIGMNPDWLIDNESENAVIDKNNLYIQMSHIRAAAAELPLTIDDISFFPDLGEVLPLLEEIGEIKDTNNSYYWNGETSPAHEISLRNITNETVKIINKNENRTLTTIDLIQAKFELYPGAIYLHETIQYHCLKLDLETKEAIVETTDSNYFTDPHITTNIDILVEHDEKIVGKVNVYFGDIKVVRINNGYKMLQFGNHTNLGYEPLTSPLYDELDTEGCWVELPERVRLVLQSITDEGGAEPYFEGIVHALQSCAEMQVMATFSDLRGDSFGYGQIQTVAVILYDQYPGGLGFVEKVFEKFEKIQAQAISLVKNCPCESGCPACVKDYRVNKDIVIWAMENFLTASVPPEYAGLNVSQKEPEIRKRPTLYTLEDIEEKWEEVVLTMSDNRFYGHAIFSAVLKVSLTDKSLHLYVSSDLENILNKEEVIAKLRGSLSTIIDFPADVTLSLKFNKNLYSDKKVLKLKRHLQSKG